MTGPTAAVTVLDSLSAGQVDDVRTLIEQATEVEEFLGPQARQLAL